MKSFRCLQSRKCTGDPSLLARFAHTNSKWNVLMQFIQNSRTVETRCSAVSSHTANMSSRPPYVTHAFSTRERAKFYAYLSDLLSTLSAKLTTDDLDLNRFCVAFFTGFTTPLRVWDVRCLMLVSSSESDTRHINSTNANKVSCYPFSPQINFYVVDGARCAPPQFLHRTRKKKKERSDVDSLISQ